MRIQPYGDNFIPVIPVDYSEHTSEKPFCWNDCPCHEDQDAINQVAGYVADGLMTPEEATDFVKGRGIRVTFPHALAAGNNMLTLPMSMMYRTRITTPDYRTAPSAIGTQAAIRLFSAATSALSFTMNRHRESTTIGCFI